MEAVSVVPLYERLVREYKDAISARQLQPGDRVDSINEMMRRHGVSRETAKRVLNILAEGGYIVQKPGKGSFVADLGPRQKVWGMVLPFYSVQYEDLLRRVVHHAKALGRTVVHYYDYNNWEEELRLVRRMLAERYEAIVVVPTLDESRTWDFYSRLSPQDSPVVLFDHTMSYRDFDFVIQSYDLGVVRAMHYLMDKHPGGIAFVKNEGWTGRNMVLELMLETYAMVLRTRRSDFDPCIVNQASGVDWRALRAAGITGLFCCDDICAIQAVGRLREQGARIPGDIGVASYGNSDLARFFTPALTSVDPHNEEMAAQLAELLSGLDGHGVQPARQVVIQPELIVRET